MHGFEAKKDMTVYCEALLNFNRLFLRGFDTQNKVKFFSSKFN